MVLYAMSRNALPTYDRIVAAALHLLSSGAGGAVRLSDVAKKAGVSRQAIYLHFNSRADLLIAATKALDQKLDLDGMLRASRTARTGRARLDAFVLAWCTYLPQIYCVARPLLDMAPKDAEASAAWAKRMSDMREGCEAAILALAEDGDLTPRLDTETATDLLWSILSVSNWENLVLIREWPQEQYQDQMVETARRLFTFDS